MSKPSFLAKLFARKEVEDQEKYHKLVSAIKEAATHTSYEYPTVPILCQWLLAHANSEPKIEELNADLTSKIGPDEDREVGIRFEKTLGQLLSFSSM